MAPGASAGKTRFETFKGPFFIIQFHAGITPLCNRSREARFTGFSTCEHEPAGVLPFERDAVIAKAHQDFSSQLLQEWSQ